MEKSKEELIEELMAKLKKDLMESRNEVAAKEDVANKEGPVDEEEAEMIN